MAHDTWGCKWRTKKKMLKANAERKAFLKGCLSFGGVDFNCSPHLAPMGQGLKTKEGKTVVPLLAHFFFNARDQDERMRRKAESVAL